MSPLNAVLTFSDQDLIPDVRPEDIPDVDPFTKEEEEEDEEETDKFLDDVANNTPNTKMFDHFEDELLEEKNEVIDIDNYERYWDNSTPNGHQIRILKQDNSTLTINLEWPKGYNPRLREVKKR